MAVYYLKQGNRSPVIEATLLNPDGTAADLTSATNVTLRMRKADRTAYTVNDTVTISDAANGVVQYQFDSVQTDDPGVYQIEWVKDLGLITEESYPNEGYDAVYIERRL